MQSSLVGLICISLLAIGFLPEGDAQLLARVLGLATGKQQQQSLISQQPQQQYQAAPLQGSVSTADSEAYNRELQIGRLIDVNSGITKSQSTTQAEDGSTNAAKSTSLTKGLNVGKLGISSTLTGSKAVDNGKVSRDLTQNLQIGKLGIESSLSKDNLKNGLGLYRSADGNVELGLGLLNIDLSRNKKQPTAGQTGTNANVQAVGIGADVNSLSNINSQTQQRGKISSTTTHSKSSAIGSVLQGFTSGQAGGFAGGAPSSAASGNNRFIRQADFYFPQDGFNPNSGFFSGAALLQNPQRKSRQFQQQLGRQPQPQIQPVKNARPGQIVQPFGQQLIQPQFFNNNANAQGLANNQNPLSNQQAAANTQNQNIFNALGQFQSNTGSSIASNLANDGTSGQLSAANTAQQNFETAEGSGNKNAAQSQALNFDKDSTQAASSNADTSQVKNGDSERIDANSGATSNQQTTLGTATNTAQTHSGTFNEDGRQGSQSNANSQSALQGANGGLAGANTGANTESVKGPNGEINNSAASQAASFSNNGGPASASASASSGTGPNGSFTNAQGLSNVNGIGSNSLAQGGIGGGRRGQTFANGFRRTRGQPRANVEPRTLDTIFNLISGLFPDTSCNQCTVYVPNYQRNCCPQCCSFPPQPLPPPPRPLPPMLPGPPLPPPPSVQITSAVFTPWYYQRPCCPTCAPQIGAFPCGRGGYGRPFPPPPPPYYYFG